MQTVLCYGDSITWGYSPADGSRFPFEQRWPGVLQAKLGDSYRIIEEGLSGHTIATDSWVLANRDGRSMRGPLLETHAPLDWAIVMLGINDRGPTYRRDVGEIAFGCATLLWTIQKAFAGPADGVPKMLLVSPPPFSKFSLFMELFYRAAKRLRAGWRAPMPRLPRPAAQGFSTRRAFSRPLRWMACIPTPTASGVSARRLRRSSRNCTGV